MSVKITSKDHQFSEEIQESAKFGNSNDQASVTVKYLQDLQSRANNILSKLVDIEGVQLFNKDNTMEVDDVEEEDYDKDDDENKLVSITISKRKLPYNQDTKKLKS